MSFLSLNLAMNVIGLAKEEKNVAIYKDTKEVLTGNMVFSSAIMSCDIAEDSQLMEHPVESGYKITDNKIFNPVEIDIRLALPSYYYKAVYNELKDIYEKSTLLRIKTRGKYYKNMVLQAMPHQENVENFDKLVFDLHFKEVMIVYPKYIKLPASQLKNAENSDTQKLGKNVSSSKKRSSILYDINKWGYNTLGLGK